MMWIIAMFLEETITSEKQNYFKKLILWDKGLFPLNLEKNMRSVKNSTNSEAVV